LSSAKRIGDVATDASDRLRVLNAQLDEAVARAVELSVHADSVGDVAPLGADVDSLVGELEALRQGLEETGGAARGTTAPQHRGVFKALRRAWRYLGTAHGMKFEEADE